MFNRYLQDSNTEIRRKLAAELLVELLLELSNLLLDLLDFLVEVLVLLLQVLGISVEVPLADAGPSLEESFVGGLENKSEEVLK